MSQQSMLDNYLLSCVHFFPERLKGEIIVFTGEHRPPRKSHKLICNIDRLLSTASRLCYVITVIKTSHSPCSFSVFQPEQTINYLHVREDYPSHPSHVHLLAFISLPVSEVERADLSAGLTWFAHWRILSPIHKNQSKEKLISPRQQPLTLICTQHCPSTNLAKLL